jgi:thiol:disulfide interchange protein
MCLPPTLDVTHAELPLHPNMVDFAKAAYGIGDCQVDDIGHHGTPNQRAAAVAFVALQIDSARNKNQILSFISRFNRVYPYIIQGYVT